MIKKVIYLIANNYSKIVFSEKNNLNNYDS